ncbi:MAG: hypothetical protein C3F11_03415 [Methylocystaceae bacterium]|nr:MAG: hypothetical protein C3F11_03415 [Methylocystaceae bacterium]
MIPVRELRFWTALAAIALCAFTISRAVTMVIYGLPELTADAATAKEKLGPFADDPAVGFLARAKLLELEQSEDAARRAADLRDLLILTPLSSSAWLELARARLGSGEPDEKVVNALAMSNLVGPNEGRLMAARAAFGFPLWPVLPPEARKTLTNDLIGGWGAMPDAERQGLLALFSLAGGGVREEARAALLLAGREGTAIARALGLGDSKRTAPAQ